MFYSLTGKLVFADTESIAIDCNGVAYLCRTTLNTISRLGHIGSTATVYTYLSVRENAMELFGFSTQTELKAFEMLIAVKGVGPRTGAGILSHITPEKLALSIAASDYKTLTNAPGIGSKTAQRIILELKDKVSNEDIAKGIGAEIPSINLGSTNINEAITALVALGYSQTQAATALAGVTADTSVQDLIKIALRALAKN